MNFKLEDSTKILVKTPFNYPTTTNIQREAEIHRQAIEDAQTAFANVSEMLKEGIQNCNHSAKT